MKGTEKIKYHSTNRNAPHVSFRDALLKGLAPDGGLYIPSFLPAFSSDDLESLIGLPYPLLASRILGRLIGSEISTDKLESFCKSVYNFNIPLEYVNDSAYIMRLDHGPTASFKDFASLLMGQLMQHYLSEINRNIIILTATSGDTGSAVANSFSGLGNIKVIILFPAGEVTPVQRKQMTTFGGNIQVIEIDGKFDDCQRLVKTAFMDNSLRAYTLSSANSINIGRLLPQSVYYFMAWSELAKDINKKMIFSVPSGNFGNLAGGLIAKQMGLPVARFVVATNQNDEVPEYLSTGKYKPIVPSRNCISSAMNVGHPSNLARIISMYGGIMDESGHIAEQPDLNKMRNDIYAISVSDNATRDTMRQFYSESGKFIEPHGAVAWYGLQEYRKIENKNIDDSLFYVSLETAHPGKFSDDIKAVTGKYPDMPESLRTLENKKEEYISLKNEYPLLKKFIVANY